MIIEVYGISGSGKSTLLRACIATLKKQRVDVCCRGEAQFIGFSRRFCAWAPIGGLDALKHRVSRGVARCPYPFGDRLLRTMWPSGYCGDRQALLAWFIDAFYEPYDVLLRSACTRPHSDRARRQRIQQFHADCMLYANLLCTPIHGTVLIDEGFFQKFLTLHAIFAVEGEEPGPIATDYLAQVPRIDAAIWVDTDPAICIRRMEARGILMDEFYEAPLEQRPDLAKRLYRYAESLHAEATARGLCTARISNNETDMAPAVEQTCAFIRELQAEARGEEVFEEQEP